jgi:hypothetical protein
MPDIRPPRKRGSVSKHHVPQKDKGISPGMRLEIKRLGASYRSQQSMLKHSKDVVNQGKGGEGVY